MEQMTFDFMKNQGFEVCEVNHTLQGEGSFKGTPVTLVRTVGCNLKCRWCDTAYALAGAGARLWKLEDVKEEVKHGAEYVLLTGGEPTLQPRWKEFVDWCVRMERTVLLETNGTQVISDVDPDGVYVIMDIKPPSSGNPTEDFTPHQTLDYPGEFKMVVADEEDLLFFEEVVMNELPNNRPVYLSPVHKGSRERFLSWAREVALYVKDLHIFYPKIDVRLSVQEHKLLNIP